MNQPPPPATIALAALALILFGAAVFANGQESDSSSRALARDHAIIAHARYEEGLAAEILEDSRQACDVWSVEPGNAVEEGC